MSTGAPIRHRPPCRLAWLVALLLVVLTVASCIPYQLYQLRTAAPKINPHQRQVQHTQHGHVRQH